MTMFWELISYGAVDIALESLAWGSFGYFFFRFLGVKEKYWYWDFLFVSFLFVMWTFFLNNLLTSLDISIGNQEFLQFFDNDIESLFKTELFDIILAIIQVLAGYLIGMFVLRRLKQKMSEK